MRQKSENSVILPHPLWGRSIAWLLFLGPFFFLSYGFSNHVAADRGVTDALFFEWERSIPFVPWTIVPYWSIDLLYGMSFLMCRSRIEVDRHAFRLLTAQLISVFFFLVFPLHFAFERPHVDGLFGAMFDALMGFDQPYNQAPSLHISLLVILWVRFAVGVPAAWRMLVHFWAVLIGLSVMTTFQHHFIDIPTGVLAGLFCLWLWPDSAKLPLSGWGFSPTLRHFRLAIYYLFGAVLLGYIAQYFKGAAFWLWWGAAAMGLVGLIYFRTGAAGFQKQDGVHSLQVRILLAPYLVCAWLNSRWWTRHHPEPDAICDDVWLGRMPSTKEMYRGGFSVLCDFSAELPAPRGNWRYMGLPWLDLVPPDVAQLTEAALMIESSRTHGPVLVCCALGYSRSASAVVAWLLMTGRANSLDAAEAIVREKRPHIVLSPDHLDELSKLTMLRSEKTAYV